jgi:hypothetical protein
MVDCIDCEAQALTGRKRAMTTNRRLSVLTAHAAVQGLLQLRIPKLLVIASQRGQGLGFNRLGLWSPASRDIPAH